MRKLLTLTLLFIFIYFVQISAQIKINEGCNKNYQSLFDEDGDSPDWIELYNAGSANILLSDYFLSDKNSNPFSWQLPDISLPPGGFQKVFCSGKDRLGSAPFNFLTSQQSFTPVLGWNQHNFSTPFVWDGVSNIIVNVCSYNSTQYTINSSFYQTPTNFASSLVAINDGSDASCGATLGQTYNQRPNVKFNGIQIGNGQVQNNDTGYPAPYGNWYWCARHQFLIRAQELISAGLAAGPLNSISFQVSSTSGEFYDYVNFSMTHTTLQELQAGFLPEQGYQLHTNFKIEATGEDVYIYNANSNLEHSLRVESPQTDISIGLRPNGSSNITWLVPSPSNSNNFVNYYNDTLKEPILSQESGVFSSLLTVSIANPNSINSKLVYTLDGSAPTFNSTVYSSPIQVLNNTVIRSRVFPIGSSNTLPSNTASSTYLIGVSHTTPILMVCTDEQNLYGTEGIFDNPNSDWIKPAHAVYLSEGVSHPMLFETRTSMRMDGGAGGSRGNPQRSFRLSFAHGALGEKPIQYPLIPDRPNRTTYSDIYLRNGSNQYLTLPYKDASQVRMMSEGTDNYYSAFRPISVYINGQYFGLYELREKFNTEYFEQHDQANKDSVELLSLSYFYNLVLRAIEGDVDNFWNSYDDFISIDTEDSTYWEAADQYFDLKHYTDYVIGESWMGNVDWPQNNIKIYRSDKTNFRWRFALIDLELSLQPNGWTDCQQNHIRYMLDQGSGNPYINIWLRSITNTKYKRYFINRFADLMNTSYKNDKLLNKEQEFYLSMFPEMDNEYARWGDPNNIAGQMQGFNNNHQTFRSELSCRNNVIRNQLVNEFELEKKVSVNLNVFPDSSGTIKLNTIEPEIYPWSGIYFDGVPIEMVPVPKPGYKFLHWLPNVFISDTLQDSLETNVSITNTSFTAIFEKLPPPPDGPEIHFNMYPNPSNGNFVIAHDNKTLASNCSYLIYDLSGRIIKEGTLSSSSLETIIDISFARSALYVIQIRKDGEELFQSKLFKSN